MPVNRQQSDSSDMDSDVSPSCGLSDLSRGDSLGSRSSSSRSRSLTLDDESLKYLTHEEKDVILFFEETIDSLEDDFEEQVECDSGLHCHSPGTLEESASGTSEPGDVIDLVQPAPPKAEEPECLPAATETADTDRRRPSTACTYIHAPSPAAQPKASSHLSPSSESPVPPAPAGAGPVAKEDTPDVVVECRKPEAGGPPSPGSAAPEAPPVLPARPVATAATSPRKELLAPPAEHPKLPRSVPTPLVIAQKMSEKLAGSEALAPPSPSKESKPGDWRTLPSGAPRNGDPCLWPRPTAQPTPKIHRFPSNISVTNSAGKEFNKTISKAAVNVQERKARVLANINGVSFLSPGAAGADPAELGRSSSPEPGPRGPSKPMGPAQEAASTRAGLQPGTQQSRGVQTEHCLPLANGFQSIHDMLRSEPSTLVSTGKTVTFRADPALATKLARQDASKSFYEPRQPGCGQDARKRSGSLPRAVGFRPQGITVQFSGRGSTEEARREALRKLGLLKENL